VAAPRTIGLLGISAGHAARLLVTAGENIERLPGEGAFAALCGASPVPASSGRSTRHRLNYGGDRQANRTRRTRRARSPVTGLTTSIGGACELMALHGSCALGALRWLRGAA
jgi:transposase